VRKYNCLAGGEKEIFHRPLLAKRWHISIKKFFIRITLPLPFTSIGTTSNPRYFFFCCLLHHIQTKYCCKSNSIFIFRTASATPGSSETSTPIPFEVSSSCFFFPKEAHESAAPAASAFV